MQSFEGRYAVISGAGSGIGRALARQLVSEGCHVALCDVISVGLEATIDQCKHNNPQQVRIISQLCDVSDEAQVLDFAAFVKTEFVREDINLLFNNAGITGGGSFVLSSQEEWERTFNVCWRSAYLMTRAFLPALLESTEGHLINVSSANAIRAVLGGHVPHTAYSAAKYAVQGFSESLINDFLFNAPHLDVSVVLPGHTGTGILTNSRAVLGRNQPQDWDTKDCAEMRSRWQIAGNENAKDMTDDEVRAAGQLEVDQLLEEGMPPAEVAQIILEGVRQKQWRILVGADTESMDELVREDPNAAYDPDFVLRWRERYQATIRNSN